MYMKMSKLHEIAAQRRLDVMVAKLAVSQAELESRAQSKLQELGGPALDLAERMRQSPPISGARMHVAAEFKRASPSKGQMAAEDLKLEDQITTYVKAGASMISVLTEPKWFKGSLEDMELAKRTILKLNPTTRPLVLRKDFLVDVYQLYEARAYGADTVLLIVAILTDDELKVLIDASRKLGMEPLVEAANEPETLRALACGAKVLGINNRDLTTFKLDLTTTNRCAALIEPSSGVQILALSGMKGREDVVAYEHLEVVRGVLVGEHLMKAENPVTEIVALVVDKEIDSDTKTLVKICGIVRPEDAFAVCTAKANFIGLIFADKSPRRVSIEEASAVAKAVRDFRETRTAIHIDLPTTLAQSGKRAKLTSWFEESAVALRKATTRGPLLVGVFMDQPLDFIRECVEKVGLDLVQLHGKESWEMCSQCGVPVIKVVHIPAGTHNISDEVIIESISGGEGLAAAILLDTTIKGGAEGGTGVSFDWSIARRYKSLGVPVMVAGGLTPVNVSDAVKEAGQPFAVDCSSGVQKSDKTPREKDWALISSFVQHVKSTL